MRRIPDGNTVAFDTEGTGLMYRHGDQAFACSFCNMDGETGYFDWPVDPHTRTVLYDEDELQIIREWLANPKIRKVMHNAVYDMGVMLWGAGCETKGPVEETQVSTHCIKSNFPTYGLKWLAKIFKIMDDDDEKTLRNTVVRCRRQAKIRGWMLGPAVEADYWMPKELDPNNNDCEEYGTRDAERTMALWLIAQEAFFEDPQLRASYEFEMRELYPVILKICQRGMWFNAEKNATEIANCLQQEEEALAELRSLAGDPDFDPGKPNHVRKLLFETLGLEVKRWTPKGKPQATVDSLALYRSVPEVRSLFRFRSANKGRTSFFQKFDHFKVVEGDGYCVYPNIKQAGKKTGRLSASDPNLMGISDAGASRSENPVESKGPFGPRPGYRWYLVDYSQLEVRIFAAFSRDKVLVDALLTGRDMHSEYTNRVWGGKDNPKAIEAAISALELRESKPSTPEVAAGWESVGWTGKGKGWAETVVEAWLDRYNYDIVKAEKSIGKKNSRSRGKEVFFSRMFWVGARTLSEYIECSVEDAQQFIYDFDAYFPGVIGYLRKMRNEAERKGYIETAYGRKLHITREELYKGASYKVQGSAADLIKRSMIDVDEIFRKRRVDAHIIVPIHDELILEIKNEHATKPLLREIKTAMESHEEIFDFPMPVKFERATESWSRTEPVEWLNQ